MREIPTRETAPHLKLSRWLSDLGLQPWNEFPVGKYTVDVFLEEAWVAVEFDGYLFHRGDSKHRRDRARDAWILERAGIPILRVSDDELDRLDDLQTRLEVFLTEHADTYEERRKLGEWVL